MTDEKIEDIYRMVEEIHSTMMGDIKNIGCIHEHRQLMKDNLESKLLKKKIYSTIVLACIGSSTVFTVIFKLIFGV